MSPNADDQMQQALAVQAKYQDMLLKMPHVVGVGVGFAKVGGVETDQLALIVMVDHKLEAQELSPNEQIPAALDGVRVDVQEMGPFFAQ